MGNTMKDSAWGPFRPLPVVAAPVFCLHCLHMVTGSMSAVESSSCAAEDDTAPRHPVTGQRNPHRPRCDDRNANRDCAKFVEKPLSWWERIAGRRHP